MQSARRAFVEISCYIHAELVATLLIWSGGYTQQSRINCAVFELDCLLAILEIKKGAKSFSEWRNIILDIHMLFQTICGVISFSHVCRVSNELAHCLPKAHSLHDGF